ncbi:TlpA disulfide reductase family protein [Porticoccaceae bacterium LTM1]|nr:TlpA disulfide reductase family protein [Porticoccaceae bacterium LTM1]
MIIKKANQIRLSLIALLSVFLLTTGCKQESIEDYPLLGGDSINFEDLHGKAVLLVYWADWCVTCRGAIEEINNFASGHKENVVTLGVNMDHLQGEKLAKQAEMLGIKFPLLLDDPRSRFGVEPSEVLPEILVIDREGRFQQLLMGPQSVEALEMVILKMEGDMDYPNGEQGT